jgi:esterase/lipase
VEYPSYSYYKGEPSEEKLYEDSETVLNFVNTVLQVPIGNIMVLGRSLGGGPALH